MPLGSDWDWDVSEESHRKIEEDFQKFAKENPDHPSVKKALKFRAEHPELDPSKHPEILKK